MKFKAKIADPQALHSKKGIYRTYTSPMEYSFSKKKIFFDLRNNDKIKKEGQIYIHWGQEYNLIRLTEDDILEWDKHSKFQAKLSEGNNVALITNKWNGILLRIIHERYWVQKNSDWIFKAIITTIIGAVIGLLAQRIGFKEGVKAGKASTQEIHQPK